MSEQTDALKFGLSVVDQLLGQKFQQIGLPDTPFVVVAINPGDELIIRGNPNPDGLSTWVKIFARPPTR